MLKNREIRRLESGDCAPMRELNAVFARAFHERETYLGDPPSEEYLEDWLASENNIALVAVEDGVVAGGLVAYALDKFERARSEIYIYDLAVAQEYRRTGIASALIARLQEIAVTKRAWVIFVQADYGDDPAIALYQKLGMREEVLHFDVAVPAGPG